MNSNQISLSMQTVQMYLSAKGMFSSWVVQRGTFKTDPGPLEEIYVAHIMTQQDTR